MPFEWRKLRPLAISRTIKQASRSVNRPRFMMWLSNGPESNRKKRNISTNQHILQTNVIIHTAFHFLKDQIKIFVIFEKINDAENVFTSPTMIINIDFFENTRSIRMTSFANDLKGHHTSVSTADHQDTSLVKRSSNLLWTFDLFFPSAACLRLVRHCRAHQFKQGKYLECQSEKEENAGRGKTILFFLFLSILSRQCQDGKIENVNNLL